VLEALQKSMLQRRMVRVPNSFGPSRCSNRMSLEASR
jgi:hypothetical protein